MAPPLTLPSARPEPTVSRSRACSTLAVPMPLTAKRRNVSWSGAARASSFAPVPKDRPALFASTYVSAVAVKARVVGGTTVAVTVAPPRRPPASVTVAVM